MKKRLLFFFCAAAAVVMMALAAHPRTCKAASPVSKPYTIIAVPDTQFYSEENSLTAIFERQIQWILENIKNENIVFVTHLGDVVDNGGDQEQWDNALTALEPLFNGPKNLLYSICQGNHDGVDLYTQYLGPERYEGKKWYIGSSPDRLNHAQTFQAGHRKFLHINLQYDPDDEDFAWAQSILDDRKYTRCPVIVSTHNYIVYGGLGATGKNIWDTFITKNPRIFMVLNGHTHTEYAFVSHNDANKPVFQMLSDYQDRSDGGEGLLRIIKIDEAAGTIDVRTFSPGYSIEDDGEVITVDPFFEEDADSQFVFTANLVERFNPWSRFDFGEEPEKPELPPADPITEPATHIFQQRLNGYAGTIDTQINENNPDLDYAGEWTLTTDLDDSGSRVHGLLAFTDIIGSNAGQIAPGSTITSAKLLFHVTSSTVGTISFHRMLIPFTEKSTWYDFTPRDPVTHEPAWHEITFWDPDEEEYVTQTVMVGGGIEADDTEARIDVDASFTCPKGYPTPFIVDVTSSVQAWADGETNYGWAMLNNSTNGWDFITCHGDNPPALVVTVDGEPLLP